MPADYQAYVDLGRFRNALVLDAALKDRRAAGLAKFAGEYGLSYFEPGESLRYR